MFIKLVGILVKKFGPVATGALAGAEVLDIVGLGGSGDQILDYARIRAAAEQEAPNSDSEALDQVAAFTASILGVDGFSPDESGILWGSFNRGPNAGEKVPANYMTIDFQQGRAWIHHRHYSKKSVNAAYKRGRLHGERNARTELGQTKDIVS